MYRGSHAHSKCPGGWNPKPLPYHKRAARYSSSSFEKSGNKMWTIILLLSPTNWGTKLFLFYMLFRRCNHIQICWVGVFLLQSSLSQICFLNACFKDKSALKLQLYQILSKHLEKLVVTIKHAMTSSVFPFLETTNITNLWTGFNPINMDL